ncbi:MAG: metallophosphoesterase [Streptococcaceae bacterium]|jgi:putative phosphoesterase|nr:metallophosphoesterase [Streptococcaceae bacterium]
MIIVMSDSHTETAVIAAIKAHYPNASAIIHCGDSELPKNSTLWQGVSVVAGNCDYDTAYNDFEVLTAENKRVLVTHGHLFNVGYGLDELAAFAQEKRANIALFGHLHRPIVALKKGVLLLNPGSVAQPRGKEFPLKMYATISVSADSYTISYKTLVHQEIPELQFTVGVTA